MKSCQTKIIINAPITTVWEILTDFDRYPEWNPLIGKIRGKMEQGKLAFAHVIPLKGIFPIRIISIKKNKAIVWRGTVLSPSIVMGEHYYYLHDLGNGQTELEHGEDFTGILTNLMPEAVLSYMQDRYEYHNQKLKIIAENRFK